jgi:hypothetical protein
MDSVERIPRKRGGIATIMTPQFKEHTHNERGEQSQSRNHYLHRQGTEVGCKSAKLFNNSEYSN